MHILYDLLHLNVIVFLPNLSALSNASLSKLQGRMRAILSNYMSLEVSSLCILHVDHGPLRDRVFTTYNVSLWKIDMK